MRKYTIEGKEVSETEFHKALRKGKSGASIYIRDDQHTPGPWEWNFGSLLDNEGKEIVYADTAGILRATPATKKLLAAAPELVQALKDLLSITTGDYSPVEQAKIQQAWDAIEKAEGR